MRGVYSLLLCIPEDTSISIGNRPKEIYEQGYWVYVGSARGKGSTSLENRLRRHFRKDKKLHWHIDYLLLQKITIVDAIWSESDDDLECSLVTGLLATEEYIPGPKGFGAGDCTRGCISHLLRYSGLCNPIDSLRRAFSELKLDSQYYSELEV